MPISIKMVDVDGKTQLIEYFVGSIEFGRNSVSAAPGAGRRIINNDQVSRDQLRIVTQDNPKQVKLVNLSGRVPIEFEGALADIAPNQGQILDLPVCFSVKGTRFEIDAMQVMPGPMIGESLSTALEPLQATQSDSWQNRSASSGSILSLTATDSTAGSHSRLGLSPTVEQVAHWMEQVLVVQQAATSTAEFCQLTAKAVVNLVGLDCCLVLWKTGEKWVVKERFFAGRQTPSSEHEYSKRIIKKVMEDRKTYFGLIATNATESQLGLRAVVASPIFKCNGGEVAGIVYGVKYRDEVHKQPEITSLEAQLVQVLAAAAGTGIVREAHENDASFQRERFSLFFGHELASVLDQQPAVLSGQEREVTLLFTDIRDYSTISEKMPPAQVCEFVQDVMTELSRCVRTHQGVIVSYVGDALLAMWNAPLDQPNHAELGCKAALAMIDRVPMLDEKWRDRTKVPIRIGVGLNTGKALVGNVGTEFRYKYGPLGHSVNLASRIEGATKHYGVPILISGSTRDQLGKNIGLATRRLAQVKVKGIGEATQLYQLVRDNPNNQQWNQFAQQYETALGLFEKQQFLEAHRALLPLLEQTENPPDISTFNLAGRILDQLKKPDSKFNPVVELESK